MLDLAFGLTDTSRLGCQVEQDICDGFTRASCDFYIPNMSLKPFCLLAEKLDQSHIIKFIICIRIYTYILDI